MATPGAGGRRQGQGRKSAFKKEERESTALEVQRMLEDITSEDKKAVLDALVALAKGVKVLACVEYRGAKRILIDHEEAFQTSYGEPCWLYTERPDTTAVKLLVEHLRGRPVAQQRVDTDTVINLVHAVPRPGRK
jgi:hypothetical protein